MGCLVCGKATPPNARRMVNPPSPGCMAVRSFFNLFVKPSFVFPESSVIYACKSPCFANMEKGMRHVGTVETIIRDLSGHVDATLSLRTQYEMSESCQGGTAVTNVECGTQTKPAAVTPLRRNRTCVNPQDSELSLHTAPITPRSVSTATSRGVKPTGRKTSLLGKRKLPPPITNQDKRLKVLPPVSLFAGQESYETTSVNVLPATLGEPSSSQQNVVQLTSQTTPASKRYRTPPQSLIKVTHAKGRTLRKFVVSSPYKQIVKVFQYNQPGYTARTLLKIQPLKEATLQELLKVIRMEYKVLCLRVPEPSDLRVPSTQPLRSFAFDAFLSELFRKAPTLLAVLKAAAQPCRYTKRECNLHVVAMAASFLLKERNQDLCMLQTIVGCLLHVGHAAKKAYTRLHKHGVCVSYSTANLVTKSLAVNHDKEVREWKSACSSISQETSSSGDGLEASMECLPVLPGPPTLSTQSTNDPPPGASAKPDSIVQRHHPDYILVGDNVDGNINPREMRVHNLTKSYHYFHSYAVRDRLDLTASSSVSSDTDVQSLSLTCFLPSLDDCKQLRQNYIVLVSRVLVEHLQFLAPLKGCVPQHIQHNYSEEMIQKSVIVPVGVIPRNENLKEEITEIMEELQSTCVPTGPNGLNTVAFGGDQLTVERSRNAQARCVNSDTAEDALEGLEPFPADWHAEANFLQIIFKRLYSRGSNCDGGTLLQLRNELNRKNVAGNPDGRFNASGDFLELIVECHMLAAAMSFFGLENTDGEPKFNRVPQSVMKASKDMQWSILARTVGRIVDRFVIVDRFTDLRPKDTVPRPLSEPFLRALEQNPHAAHVVFEHAYTRTESISIPVPTMKRKLPNWLKNLDDRPHPSQAVCDTAPDGVFDHASAVLNDGLLLMEFRDAIHEGDGERILRCWKLLMLYYRFAGHTKYALEAFLFAAKVNGVYSPRLRKQILWSRVVNPNGGRGKKIPIDLHMEHLNRMLKDIIKGVGANVSESTIVSASRSLNSLVKLSMSLDNQLGIHQESTHHTKRSSDKDREVVLKQLTVQSKVFDYVPGRKHLGMKTVMPNIARTLDAGALFKWIDNQQKKLAKDIKPI